MNNVAAGIGGAVAAVVIVGSAMVFANRSSNEEADAAPQTVASTHTVCTDEKVVTKKEWGGNSVAGTLIGGVAGGVLGHQVGGGRGRDVATAAGAAGGAYVGHEVANDHYPDEKVSYRQNCHSEPG